MKDKLKRKDIYYYTKNFHGKKHPTAQYLQQIKKVLIHPFFIAVFSALMIGLIFGMITLQIVNKEMKPQELEATTSPVNDQVSTSDQKEIDVQTKIVPFHTIQLGVFQDKENAVQLTEKLQKHNLSSFIWQKEDEYYVLMDAYTNENEARETLKKVTEMDQDAFIKQWEAAIKYDQLNDEEVKWIEDFISTWEHSLQIVSAGKEFPIGKWEILAKPTPDVSEKYLSFHQEIIPFIESSLTSYVHGRHILISLLSQIERTSHNN